MQRTVAGIVLAGVLLAGGVIEQQEKQPEIDLQAAIRKETVDGDLKGAIAQYQKIVAANRNNHEVAATALVHLGRCYEKLGDAQAKSAYDRVLSEYPDQKELAATARARLAALGGAGKAPGTAHQITGLPFTPEGVSPDGRYLFHWNWDSKTEEVALEALDLTSGQVRKVIDRPSKHYEGTGDALFSPDSHQLAYLQTHLDMKDEEVREIEGRFKDEKDPIKADLGGFAEMMPHLSTQLRVVNLDGSNDRAVAQFGTNRIDMAGWFPDGKRMLALVRPGPLDQSELELLGSHGLKLPATEDAPLRLVAVSMADGTVTPVKELPSQNGKEIGDPQLSPDGASVVYTRRVRENPAADQLWLLRLADRSETLLFEGQSTVGDPLWTPDGAGVVFMSDRRAPGTALDLWLLRISGGKALGFPELVKTGVGDVTNGHPMTWAIGPITRDGTYYFHRNQQNTMIQLMTTKFDPDTGKVVGAPSFVSQKGGMSRSPSLSQDGRWLAYVSQGMNLVIQSVESGEERVVPMTPSPVSVSWAVIFPDGRSVLAAATHPKDGWGMYRVDVASGTWTSLNKPGAPDVTGWANGISPDGKTIYLSRYPVGAVRWRLLARDADTGEERQLDSGAEERIWALSHDGKQLAVTRPDGKDVVIEVMPAAGGPKREVYRGQGLQWADVTWTPDGRYLIFAPSPDKAGANTKAYMRVSVDGGEAQPIGISASQDEQVQFPRSFGAVRVHPNGRQIFYTARGVGGRGIGSQSEVWALENFIPGLKASK